MSKPKRAQKELAGAMSTFLDIGSDTDVIGGVLTNPFRPEIVYPTGLCVDFTHSKETCAPGKLDEFIRAEVKFRTYERYVPPTMIFSLWRSVAGRKKADALIFPNLTIPAGKRGFIPPIDTLVRKSPETHVVSYDPPPETSSSVGNSVDFAEWASFNYYSQGAGNKELQLQTIEDLNFIKSAKSKANALRDKYKIFSRDNSTRLPLTKHKIGVIEKSFLDVEYSLNGSIFSMYGIYESTTLSLVMLGLNVASHR